MTVASSSPKPSSQIVPGIPSKFTTTRPALDVAPPTSLTMFATKKNNFLSV